MATGLLLARLQLRHGWRNLIGIAVLIGLAGGLVLGGLAGAHRTSTAVDRMIARSNMYDVLVNPVDPGGTALTLEALQALPMVDDAHAAFGLLILPDDIEPSLEGVESSPYIIASGGAALFEVETPLLSEGRLPDPTAADEIYVDARFAADRGIEVGDVLRWRVPSWDDLGQLFSSSDEHEIGEVLADPTFATPVSLEVTGVGYLLDSVAADEGYEPVPLWGTPALYEQLGSPIPLFWGAVVRMHDSFEVSQLRAAIDTLAPGESMVYQTVATTEAKVERATAPGATALMIFAGITALAGLLLVAQAISRRLILDSSDNNTLAVLGTTRSQRFIASMARMAATAALGTALAIPAAWLLSWFTPVGPARRAEPAPGFDFAPAVLLGGGALVFGAVLLASLPSAWRSARRVTTPGVQRPSRIANGLSAAGAPVQMTTGLRFGLEPGRGVSAVPTRATIIGIATAVAITGATLVVAASLDRVVSDPKFYGSNFDDVIEIQRVGDEILTSVDVDGMVRAVVADDAVEAASELRVGEIEVGGTYQTAIAFSREASGIDPTIADGRAPRAADEIALGANTMEQLGVRIGDRIPLSTPSFRDESEVVGQVVLPGVGVHRGGDKTSLGIGALVAPEALEGRIYEGGQASSAMVVARLRPEADSAEFEARVDPELLRYGVPLHTAVARPSDIQSLERMRPLLLMLASALLILVSATIINAMLVAVRRRRRDFAVLEALGSTRASLQWVGVWQGFAVGIAGLVLGLPVGVIAGRWFWILLAEEFGTLAQPEVPVLAVVTTAALVVAVAGLLGLIPVRRGLRRPASEALRSE